MPRKATSGRKGKKGKKKAAKVPEPPPAETFGPFGDQCKVLTADELLVAAKKGKKGKKKKKAVAAPVIEWAARLQVNRHSIGAQVLVPNGASDQSIELSINCREFDPILDTQACTASPLNTTNETTIPAAK